MPRYAAETSVSVENSRAEIETILRRYGADAFGYYTEATRAVVQFRFEGWSIRFEVPLPDPEDPEFARTPKRRQRRTPEAREAAWEQACRQRWRALALAIKAKLEAVECEITSFEEEFLAHLVLPSGRTVAQHALPQLRAALESGRMPKSLLGLPAAPDEVIGAEVID